jgi:hypothetical protein
VQQAKGDFAIFRLQYAAVLMVIPGFRVFAFSNAQFLHSIVSDTAEITPGQLQEEICVWKKERAGR